MLQYRPFGSDRLADVRALYEKEGWRAYLNDDRKLEDALQNSLWLYGAFEGDRLIGFVRCVGDGQHILLVQDLIVDPDFRGQGIGTALFNAAWETYAHVRMFMVVTDIPSEGANRFYQRLGMKPLEKGQMIGYFR
ncbi:MAG: GNAT family N-acetyltransferase [Clostridia bacterium]|nr:GNAT family N-acetyltransferase [Clostridia bacterium]